MRQLFPLPLPTLRSHAQAWRQSCWHGLRRTHYHYHQCCLCVPHVAMDEAMCHGGCCCRRGRFRKTVSHQNVNWSKHLAKCPRRFRKWGMPLYQKRHHPNHPLPCHQQFLTKPYCSPNHHQWLLLFHQQMASCGHHYDYYRHQDLVKEQSKRQ